MSDVEVDLEALFDEISSQRVDEPSPAAIAAPAAAPAVVAGSTTSSDDHAPQTDHGDGADGDSPDKPMFERLGGIVRLLHDSLRELGYDRSLSSVASDITDAKGRLEHVATLTEQAANKVLNTIDEGMPAQDALSKDAKDIEGRWDQLF